MKEEESDAVLLVFRASLVKLGCGSVWWFVWLVGGVGVGVGSAWESVVVGGFSSVKCWRWMEI